MTLGQRIQQIRLEYGLSQEELAEKLEVSPSAVGMYEQGRREPSTGVLLRMSELFGVTVDYLLKGVPEEAGTQAMEAILDQMQDQLALRKKRPLSREELAVLFAAMLMES